MYLNTSSGLQPLFDAIGTTIENRNTQHSLAQAGLANEPSPGILSGLLGSFGLGGTPPTSAPRSAPASPAVSDPTPAPTSSLPTFAAAPDLGKVSPNAQTALSFFQGKGLSPMAAAGLVGGFTNESGAGLNTNAMARGDGSDGSNSIGIGQWNGDRARALQQFATTRGVNPSDLRTQLEFAWSELTGPESKTLAALKSATNPMQATAAALGYERPAGWTADNPFGAKTFGQRMASTVGLSKVPVDASAYAPAEASGTDTPTGAAIASMGRQANAAAGAAPMPIATASTNVTPTAQPPSATSSGAAPAGLAMPTTEQIKGLVSEPSTRELGLKLWQQQITGKNFGFQVTPAGDVLRTNDRTGQAEMILRAPVKQGFQELNGHLLATDPQAGTAHDVTPDGMATGYRWATPDERKAAGVQEGAPLYIGPGGKPGFGSGGTNVTLNNAIDPLQKAAGDRFDRSLQAADSAARTLPALRTARQQLNAGIFAGALSGEKMGLQKLAGSLGLPGIDTNRITNTETFNAAVGPVVLQLVKGLGAGAGISNADRDFAERMAGGNHRLEASSINRILDIQERAAMATISQHNSLVDQIQQSPAGAAAYRNIGPAMRVTPPAPVANTKTIGGVTYHQGQDGHWYSGQ